MRVCFGNSASACDDFGDKVSLFRLRAHDNEIGERRPTVRQAASQPGSSKSGMQAGFIGGHEIKFIRLGRQQFLCGDISK
jgi:hypothetical protein